MKNNKKSLLITIAALVVVVGAALLLYKTFARGANVNQIDQAKGTDSVASGLDAERSAGDEDTADHPEESETLAPDITVYDQEGNEVHLSDFRGKPVVLNFWASWCPPCKAEMPDFNDKYAEFGEDVTFLMVNMTDGQRETQKKAKDFVADQGFSFPIYFDTDSSAAMTYTVFSIPTTYFIDRDGKIVANAQGAIDSENLAKGIGMIQGDSAQAK